MFLGGEGLGSSELRDCKDQAKTSERGLTPHEIDASMRSETLPDERDYRLSLSRIHINILGTPPNRTYD